jgi:transcriptional regulator with XRE-family HTH domain
MQQHRSRPPAAATAEDLFGQVLRELRHGRGLSQEELAFRSGYHPTYIGQLERGKKSPSLRAILSIATALSTSASKMLQRLEARIERPRADD